MESGGGCEVQLFVGSTFLSENSPHFAAGVAFRDGRAGGAVGAVGKRAGKYTFIPSWVLCVKSRYFCFYFMQ
jgi:hypothetical protein